jgi:flagellar basal-body rod protein FlgB
VPDFSDAAVVAALRRSMTVAAAKQVVTASNLANVNTPGYRAKEAIFSAALDQQMGLQLATTQPGHVGGAGQLGLGGDTREVEGLQARRDGNNVQIDRELLNMARAGGEFNRAQTALAAKFRLVRYAIAETR